MSPPRKKTVSPSADAPTFETALDELENIVERLDGAELTLDDSLQLFERGIVLVRICDTHLKSAQGRISELLKGENGEYVERIIGETLESFVARDDSDA